MKDLAALLKYAEQFRSLHTSFTQANNRAPHKFILLYSLCLLYESGSLHTEKLIFGYAFGRMAGNIQTAMAAVGGKRIPPRKFRHAALPHEDRAVLVFLCQTWYGRCIRTKKPHEGFIHLRQTVSGVEIDALLARLLRQAETRVVLQDVMLAQLFEIL